MCSTCTFLFLLKYSCYSLIPFSFYIFYPTIPNLLLYFSHDTLTICCHYTSNTKFIYTQNTNQSLQYYLVNSVHPFHVFVLSFISLYILLFHVIFLKMICTYPLCHRTACKPYLHTYINITLATWWHIPIYTICTSYSHNIHRVLSSSSDEIEVPLLAVQQNLKNC